MSLLRFHDTFERRIWGGQKLRTLFEKDIPADPIGEDWLISDHSSVQSVIADGEFAGLTLHDLIERDARRVLGETPRLTPAGRFPLLLKLLDAADVLSVQVHPDDDCAQRLGEPDVGKTEMWHVLQAEPGAQLVAGLVPDASRDQLRQAVQKATLDKLMVWHQAYDGMSILIPAGTVHAIGKGIVLAEIQQNSDLTYRLYDWNRVDNHGNPRPLHLDKALEATQYQRPPAAPAKPIAYESEGAQCHLLAACPHFAAELVEVEDAYRRHTAGRSFHIVLVKSGRFTIAAAGTEANLAPGQCALITGGLAGFEAVGNGSFLDYYVPDIAADIVNPLRQAGHPTQAIKSLGAGTF